MVPAVPRKHRSQGKLHYKASLQLIKALEKAEISEDRVKPTPAVLKNLSVSAHKGTRKKENIFLPPSSKEID